MKRTAVHELLHGLGFEHEHQRKDAELYLEYPENCENDQDLVVKDNYFPLTAFDPYSIMFYKEQDEESEGFCRDSHKIWESKKGDSSLNTQLSELDKVGLNLVYPPCTGTSYDPKKDEETGMYYCGRVLMDVSLEARTVQPVALWESQKELARNGKDGPVLYIVKMKS